MFYHVKEMQYQAKPERPDPLYARRLQELVGGQFGEMTVMMGYLFQGWNCRGPQKYRDMRLDIATEEIGHVEMLAVMIARLLEGAPLQMQESAAASVPVVGAVLGGLDTRDAIFAGMNPQHAIVAGLGAQPKDSMGVPWNGNFIAASGNLLADFRWNLMAESQGNLQVGRLYSMTEDTGVRDMLSFNWPGTSCTRTSGRPPSKSYWLTGWKSHRYRATSRATACCWSRQRRSGISRRARRAGRAGGGRARRRMGWASSSIWRIRSLYPRTQARRPIPIRDC